MLDFSGNRRNSYIDNKYVLQGGGQQITSSFNFNMLDISNEVVKKIKVSTEFSIVLDYYPTRYNPVYARLFGFLGAGFQLRHNNTSGSMIIQWNDGNGRSLTVTAVSLHTWHRRIVMWKKDNFIKHYASPSTIQQNTLNPNIANMQNLSNIQFTALGGTASSNYECAGYFRNIGIIDRVLTDDEITKVYSNEFLSVPWLCFLKCNQKNGSLVIDSSNGKNHGQLFFTNKADILENGKFWVKL